MMDGLRVDTGAMDNSGKNTIARAEEFARELDGLKNLVDNLMSIWHGAAAEEFNNAFQAQAANLKDFQKLLDELGSSIRAGARVLNNAEEENISDALRLD